MTDWMTEEERKRLADRVRAKYAMRPKPEPDLINHPPHYTSHPSGVECIQVTEHFNFNRGNAIKYLWRAGAKGDEITDLEKARFYIDREIQRLKKSA